MYYQKITQCNYIGLKASHHKKCVLGAKKCVLGAGKCVLGAKKVFWENFNVFWEKSPHLSSCNIMTLIILWYYFLVKCDFITLFMSTYLCRHILVV